MGLLDWRNRSIHRIDAVVVPERALAESNPETLPMYVSMFVRHALDDAMYNRDELPREAVLATHVYNYMGEVDNGGHAQFVGNTSWNPDMRNDIREALAILGLDEAARIFADLEAFAENEPARFRCIGGMGSAAQANLFRPGSEPQTIDPYFDELDLRLYRDVGNAIVVATSAWLKTRPWVRAIPDEEYARIHGWKMPDHPRRDARREAWKRRTNFDLNTFLTRLREYLNPRKPS